MLCLISVLFTFIYFFMTLFSFFLSRSIFGAVRTGSYMTYILMTKGLKQSVCDQSFYNGPVSKFWAYAFVLSKAPELGKSRTFLYKILLSFGFHESTPALQVEGNSRKYTLCPSFPHVHVNVFIFFLCYFFFLFHVFCFPIPELC